MTQDKIKCFKNLQQWKILEKKFKFIKNKSKYKSVKENRGHR